MNDNARDPSWPAWRRGARRGFRIGSYVAGSIAVPMLLVGLGRFGIGPGTGGGRAWPTILREAAGIYLVGATAGALVGAVVGLARGRAGRAMDGQEPSSEPGEETRAKPRRPSWRWFVGTPALVALAVGVALLVILGWSIDHRLRRMIAETERTDPHWQLDDLLAHRRPVPDEENGALVVADVAARLPDPWPETPKPPPGGTDPPEVSVRAALDRIDEREPNVRLDDAAARVLRDELARLDEAVRIARTVANYEHGRHELVIGPTVLDTLLKETQAARNVARLLQADAAVRARAGDLDGALESCRAILGTARSIGDEPFLVSQLVRIAIGSLGTTAARRVLGQGEASDAALARLQADLLREVDEPLLLYAMRGERAMDDEIVRRIGTGQISIWDLTGPAVPESEGLFRRVASLGVLWIDHQRTVMLKWMNRAVAIAKRPSPEWPALYDAWDAEVVRTKSLWHGPFSATIPVLMAPALSAMYHAVLRYRSELGATTILLAAERQRLRTGRWPESIEAIDPSILPRAPLDPWTGRPFLMEHADGQLRVYSVGPNGEDNHGAYNVRKWASGGPEDDVGSGLRDVPRRGEPPGKRRP